jgi:hypothetical protein
MADLHTSPPGQIYAGPPLPTLDHIRLLSLQPGSDDTIIKCELVATELHLAQAYEALSYTWGDLSNYQVIHITIPGSGEPKEFPVTSNCFSALTRLRLKEQPRILWIDALCIYQDRSRSKCCRNLRCESQLCEGRCGFAVPFGGTITHHRMPPNTMAAHVAYFWRGKDKPTSLAG